MVNTEARGKWLSVSPGKDSQLLGTSLSITTRQKVFVFFSNLQCSNATSSKVRHKDMLAERSVSVDQTSSLRNAATRKMQSVIKIKS